jgi:hypothetical protein
VAVIVDDLLVYSKQSKEIISFLTDFKNYELKGVGLPEYYSGADLEYDEDNGYWIYSAKTYVKNVCERIEKLLQVKLKNYGSPMEPGNHPEMDESDLLVGSEIAIYQMLIGCAQWAVTLGRIDVQFATNTFARFSNMPREGHRLRALRRFGYLKHFLKAGIHLDFEPLNLSKIEFATNDWTDLYPDAEEYVSDKIPTPKNKVPLKINVMVDASHADDLVTRRSVT